MSLPPASPHPPPAPWQPPPSVYLWVLLFLGHTGSVPLRPAQLRQRAQRPQRPPSPPSGRTGGPAGEAGGRSEPVVHTCHPVWRCGPQLSWLEGRRKSLAAGWSVLRPRDANLRRNGCSPCVLPPLTSSCVFGSAA